jgi:hypothetical protein
MGIENLIIIRIVYLPEGLGRHPTCDVEIAARRRAKQRPTAPAVGAAKTVHMDGSTTSLFEPPVRPNVFAGGGSLIFGNCEALHTSEWIFALCLLRGGECWCVNCIELEDQQ